MNENKQYVSKINGYYVKDSDARESKADKSTTYTKTEVDTALGNKADKSTTLDGYGITDAYTKSEVDSALVNLPNTYVITGTETLPENDTGGDSKKHTFTIDYPTGFTKNNTYVLAFQGSIEQGDNMGAFGYGTSVSGGLLHGLLDRAIYLSTSKINIEVYNTATSDKDYNYKILLMRIDPEETTNGGE